MLIVIRHGPTLWNVQPRRCQGQTDIPLSEEGCEAARERARSLPEFDSAYSSHLSRAKETAEILLSQQVSTPRVRVDPRLAEAACGRWEGVLHDEIEQAWPEDWAALAAQSRTFCFPGGESLVEVQARFSQAMVELDACNNGKTVLVVTHGGPMRLFLGARGVLASTRPGAPPGNLEGFQLEDDRIKLIERP